MAVERPTFNESWYRVAELRPRLKSAAQIYRQHFRGRQWHVVRDPSSNQFFRLPDSAYRFVGMLDGQRTVAEVWRLCNEQLGDDAVTQGEAIQLLGQLYNANLLQSELPGDTETLFKRFRQRRTREIQGFLTNLLFVRIPLIDPDRFLDRWVAIFGRLFTWYGLVLWVAILALGGYFLVGRGDQLMKSAQGILDTDNLAFLYIGFALVKVCHEFGHAFSCKRFGQLEGGGEVHEMGVMFLVFAPVPYVDASATWAFRSKWRRLIVGAGGMLVELPIAALAAVVWANTMPGHPLNAICYNIMFVASVSTLLFNGNPLLRYDAYYMLSDLLEIPNFYQRSRSYLHYLVRRYVWGVKAAQNPAHTSGERVWLLLYAVSSLVYRVFISSAILLFVADKLFVLGTILAMGAVVAWVMVPLVKFLRYLFTSGELARVRPRAFITTILVLGAVGAGLGAIPMSDHYRVEGIVEPEVYDTIYAGADGFVRHVLPSGQQVEPNGAPVVVQENFELVSKRDQLEAELRRLTVTRRQKEAEDLAAAQVVSEQIATVGDEIRKIDGDLASLSIHPARAGTWIFPDMAKIHGAYLHRGDELGRVISPGKNVIRAVAGQDVDEMVFEESRPEVEIRAKGRPSLLCDGVVTKKHPMGEENLPSPALSVTMGGTIATEPDEKGGVRPTERIFQVEINPQAAAAGELLAGQRVIVRFRMKDKPLAQQGWDALLRVIQKRFHE